MSAFSMYRRKGTINKKFSDHLSIKLVLNMSMLIRRQNNKRKPIINIHNKEGWIRYPEVTDKYAELIQDAVVNIEDSNKLESRLFSIDQAIKVEAFGVIWVRQGGNSRKRKKRESKEMNTLYNEYLEEIDAAISESLDRKDNNSKMYKLKSLVAGPNAFFVISRPVRQALLGLVQQALLGLVQQVLLGLVQQALLGLKSLLF